MHYHRIDWLHGSLESRPALRLDRLVAKERVRASPSWTTAATNTTIPSPKSAIAIMTAGIKTIIGLSFVSAWIAG